MQGYRFATNLDLKLVTGFETHLLDVTFTDLQLAVELHFGFVGKAATTLATGLHFKAFGFEQCFVESGVTELAVFVGVATLADQI